MDINTILTSFFNAIMPSLAILMGGLVSYYLVKVTARIKAETNTIQDKATRDLADETLDVLTNLVDTNVESAQNTIVKELKQTTVDGKLDVDDAKNVLQIVKSKILAQLSDSGKQTLSTIINDLEGYVESKIEVSLKNLKDKSNDANSSDNISKITTEPIQYSGVKVEDIATEEDVCATQER